MDQRTAWLVEHLTGTIWSQVSWLSETGSTNADLAVQARAGAREGSVLISDFQSQGRGRFTRQWVAPRRSAVAMSTLVRPADVEISRWTWLPLLVGLAVAEGIQLVTGLSAQLKWPNDVLINGRKICGILCERADTLAGPSAVLGMGINTLMTTAEIPVPTATSLAIEGVDVEVKEVVLGVLLSLAAKYQRWLAGDDLSAEYLEACLTIGREVAVVVSKIERVVGQAEGVDTGGALLVRVDGQLRSFSAGDVLHLR